MCKLSFFSSFPPQLDNYIVDKNKISAFTCTHTRDLVSHYNVFLRFATSLLYKKLPEKVLTDGLLLSETVRNTPDGNLKEKIQLTFSKLKEMWQYPHNKYTAWR